MERRQLATRSDEGKQRENICHWAAHIRGRGLSRVGNSFVTNRQCMFGVVMVFTCCADNLKFVSYMYIVHKVKYTKVAQMLSLAFILANQLV